MSIETEVQMGEQARAVLENEAFKGAFDSLTNELVEQWKKTPARGEDDREKLYLMLRVAEKVRAHLESLMVSGRMAKEKRTLQERMAASARAFVD
jgi:hypothetical protein